MVNSPCNKYDHDKHNKVFLQMHVIITVVKNSFDFIPGDEINIGSTDIIARSRETFP